MKTASKSLYQLIQALSKTEKRYFNLFAKRHAIGSTNSYLELFEIINRHSLQNDEELLVYEKDFRFSKHLPVVKKQLLDNLLKALTQFDESSSIDESIKQHCHKAKILFAKGLAKESEKYLKKAKKEVLAYERFHLMMEIIQIQKQIISQQYYNQTSFERLEQLKEETEHYLKILSNKNDYWLLFSKVYKMHFQDAGAQKKEHQENLLQLLESPLLNNETLALSTSASLDFLQLNALKKFIQKEPKKAFQYNQQFLQKFEENPNLIQTQAIRYRSTLNNFLIDCVQLNYETELKNGLITLRSLATHKAFKKIKGTNSQIFRLSYQIELNWNISKGDFSQNCSLVPTLTQQLNTYKHELVPQSLVVFYYIIAYSFFAIGDFDKALTWSNKIIHETEENLVEDLQAAARILNMLAHFEMENIELLLYLMENTKRFFKKHNRLSDIESLLFSVLNKLAKQAKSQHKSIYQDGLSKFKNIKKKTVFNYTYWLESKLSGKTYEVVYNETTNQ